MIFSKVAFGLAAYCVIGADKGLSVTGSTTIAVAMGMLTGTLGGILRDVLANEPSVLLRRDVHVTDADLSRASRAQRGALGARADRKAGLWLSACFFADGAALFGKTARRSVIPCP